jgi:hypothetical protein
MKATTTACCLALLAAGWALAAPATSSTSTSSAPPVRPAVFDPTVRLDVNDIAMFLTNDGSFAWDLTTGNAGLEFPRGSGKTAVFAGGLWLGARVGGQTRVTVAEYSQEYAPGAAVGGVADVPSRPEYKVYKLERVYADPGVRDAALADYASGAVPHGAPAVAVLPDGSLSILGDQMCWAVYNDLDPAAHNNQAGSTAPLGVEVQQTTFAYDRPGALASTVFIRYKIIDRGPNTLDDVRVAIWVDPDLGGFTDDLVGCVPAAGLGYCYNATNSDLVYGAAPPAVGFDLLQGPYDPGILGRRGLTAFSSFVTGTDPTAPAQSFNYMHGLDASGAVMVDGVTFLPTTYRYSGDPVANAGWLDPSPGDKRMLLSSGPTTMLPGDVQEVVVAVILAQGADRLGSITRLRAIDAQVRTAFEAGALQTLAVEAPGTAEFSLAGARPNPSAGELTVAFSLRHGSPATLELLDVGGRRLRAIPVGDLGPGRHVIGFGRESRLPAGLYFVRLSQGGRSLTTKVAVIR